MTVSNKLKNITQEFRYKEPEEVGDRDSVCEYLFTQPHSTSQFHSSNQFLSVYVHFTALFLLSTPRFVAHSRARAHTQPLTQTRSHSLPLPTSSPAHTRIHPPSSFTHTNAHYYSSLHTKHTHTPPPLTLYCPVLLLSLGLSLTVILQYTHTLPPTLY